MKGSNGWIRSIIIVAGVLTFAALMLMCVHLGWYWLIGIALVLGTT